MSTLPDLLRRRMAADGARIILRRKDRGIWKPVRWAQLGDQVRALAQALCADGFGRGMVGAVLADTRPEWVVADLAMQAAGGICAGLSPIAGPEEISAQLREAAISMLFVENEEQLDKILALRSSCPLLRRIVIFEMKGLRDLNDPICLSLAAFVELGAVAPDSWNMAIDALDLDAPAALVYTEDSAGQTHPVRLSHRHLTAVVEAATHLFGLRVGDERLAMMPMAHVSERVLGVYLSLHTGCISNYGESIETLDENLREVKPTVLVAAPWFWKQLRDRIELAARAATWTQRLLLRMAFPAGTWVAADLPGRSRHSAPWHAATSLLAWPVLVSVRRALGLSRLRLGLIAGGIVPAEIIRWFMILGIGPIELYGPAACAGLAAASAPSAVRPGDCGPPIIPDTLRLSAAGEIEINRVLTDADGPGRRPPVWLPTGDAGVMTDGRLTVLGPLADTITLLGGIAVHPGPIERALSLSPYIADALVVGAGSPFLGCLLRLDADAAENWAHAARVPFTSFAELVRTEGLLALLAAEVARVNAGVAQKNPVRAFRLIDRRLQYGDPELTLLGTLRRPVVLASFQNLIAGMYDEGLGYGSDSAQHASELTKTGA